MKAKFLFTTCLMTLVLFSCKDKEPFWGDDNNQGVGRQKYVKFDASIENQVTKASGTTWDSGDAIGVYMKAAGANLSAASEENIKYTTPGDGTFTAATTGIELPADGSNVDFIAYYPYQTTITGLSYPVNTAIQTSLPAIDLLYSNNAVNANKTNNVSMDFKHMLSLLVLNVAAGDGVSDLTGLGLSATGLTTDGSFDLSNGAITLGTATATLTPAINATSTTAATVNAILVPGQNLNAAELVFTLSGKTYKWTPATQTLETGKKYTYSIQLSASGVVVVNPEGSIEDWIDGNPGEPGIIITPEEPAGFTVDQTSPISWPATVSNVAVQLTAPSTEAWTAASSETWLTVGTTSGTGSASIALSATANTGVARSATVTITPTNTAITPVTITVNQADGTTPPAPTGALLFPGSDFENWTAFTGSLNTYGILSHGTHSATGGRSGTGALLISNTTATTGNQYLFTNVSPTSLPVTSPTKITLYIKGTATGKSLSFNVYVGPNAVMGTDYKCYNLGVISATTDVSLTSADTNSYAGSIDTQGAWVKVTLDISALTINTSGTGSLFALKTGSSATYNLLVDDITIE